MKMEKQFPQQRIITALMIFSLVSATTVPAFAADSQQLDELQSKVQLLEQQVNALKANSTETTPAAAPKGTQSGFEYKGVHVTLGGFLASETVERNNNMESDLGTSYGKIPFANSAGYGQTEFRGTERQSRFSLLVQGDPTDNVHLAGYYEIDFFGTSPSANPNESNSFTPRTRNVYMTVDWENSGLHLLAGQNWSLLTLNSKGIAPRSEYVPQTIDPQYAVGFNWARQWQVRLAKDWDKKYWAAVSLENSQTVGVSGALASGTGNTYQLASGNLFNPGSMSINAYPDVIIKGAVDTDFGHFEIYDLNRNFQSRYGGTTLATQNNKQNSWISAIGVGALIPVMPKTLDVAVSGLFGKGIGRYGTASMSDATYRADGGLQPLQGAQYLAQLTWHASEQWEAYLSYGRESLSSTTNGGAGYGDGIVATNAGCSALGGTCAPNTKEIAQSNIGAWWSFFKGNAGTAKLGLQYSHTTLGTFADANGIAPNTSEDMFFTSLRYYPF